MSSHSLPPAPSLPPSGSISLPPSSSLSASNSGGSSAMQGVSPTGGSNSAPTPLLSPHSASPSSASSASSNSSSSPSPPLQSPTSSPADLRSSLFCLARTAERSERWEDVCRFMKELIKLTPIQHAAAQQSGIGVDGVDLSEEERHLLLLGYKQVIGQQRHAWRVLRQIQQSSLALQQQQQQLIAAAAAQSQAPLPLPQTLPSGGADERFLELQEDYKQQIEKELHLQCSEMIGLIETCLIPHSHKAEAKVFYMKMCGDFYRYLSELVLARVGFSPSGLPGGYDKKSHECYAMAYKLAVASLPSNHPTRLSTALNLAVCLWEILRERKAACELAKAAFDGAIAKLEELEEAKYKDATLIMQLLRDNLTLWTAQANQQQPQT